MDIFEADAQQKEEEFRNWWHENWKSIIGGIVVALVFITAFWVYRDYRHEQRQIKVSDFYTTVFEADISSAEVQKRIATYATENSNVLGQLAAIKIARQEIEADKLQDAFKVLKDSLNKGDDILDNIVRLRAARLAIELRQFDEAQSLLSDVDDETFAKAVAEIKGDVLLANGDKKGAIVEYKRALDLSTDKNQARVLQMKHDALLETEGVNALDFEDAKVETKEVNVDTTSSNEATTVVVDEAVDNK